MRKNATSVEDAAWTTLRTFRKLGYPVRRQHPIGKFTVDFAITKAKLIIEFDGGIHNHPEVSARDEKRDAKIASEGWRILRLSNDDASHPDHLFRIVADALELDV